MLVAMADSPANIPVNKNADNAENKDENINMLEIISGSLSDLFVNILQFTAKKEIPRYIRAKIDKAYENIATSQNK